MPADDRRKTWELSRLSRRQRGTVPFQNRPRKAVFLPPASLLACWVLAPPLQAAEDADSHRPDEFLRLCDLAVAELDKPVLPFTYVADELAKRPPLCCLTTWEAATWLTLSYAEQLRPGALFRAK